MHVIVYHKFNTKKHYLRLSENHINLLNNKTNINRRKYTNNLLDLPRGNWQRRSPGKKEESNKCSILIIPIKIAAGADSKTLTRFYVGAHLSFASTHTGPTRKASAYADAEAMDSYNLLGLTNIDLGYWLRVCISPLVT